MVLILPQWQGAGEESSIPASVAHIRNAFFQDYRDGLSLDGDPSGAKDGIRHYDSILANAKAVRRLLEEEDPETILLIGGECSTEIMPISFLRRKYGDVLAVLWFDAHADLNRSDESPSGNLHGMPLRLLLGEGDEALLGELPAILAPGQVTLAGIRELDPAEERFIAAKSMRCLLIDDLVVNRGALKRGLLGKKLYVHIDLDVLDPRFFPYTVCPTKDGISMEALLGGLRDLASSCVFVGIGIVEYKDKEGLGVGRLGDLIDFAREVLGETEE
jgi:arginase